MTKAGRPSTMADVARLAGVSTATVSHVLNKTRSLAPETEARVRDAVAKLGYIPDRFARSLRTRSSDIVGVAMSAITNQYFARAVGELERNLAGLGMSILLADTHDDPQNEAKVVQDLIALRPSGIILAPSSSPEYAIQLAAKYDVPLVIVDRIAAEVQCDQIAVENMRPVERITSHLLGLGHTRIAMVCGLPGLSTTDERRRGFEIAHEAADVEVDLTLVTSGQGTVAGAEAAARVMLHRSDPPSAIVSGNNAMTIGIMSAARDAHMRVPEDLALVCFDDFEWEIFKPRLTAIAQPIEEMANRAVEMLRTRAADADEPDPTGASRPSDHASRLLRLRPPGAC